MRPNKIAQGASNTQPAKLPAINIPATADPALRQALEAIKERLEVREGARGNPYERVVTLRDLDGMGLSAGSSSSASAAATRLGAGAGDSSPGKSPFSNDEAGDIGKTINALQRDIRNGALYGALGSGIDTKRINSVIEGLKQRVEGVRSELETAVDGVSRKLSAYAGSETTARTTADSATAKQVSALQAAFNSNVASVLKEQDVLASETQAVARDVTTLAARLDNSDGTGVSIEQRAEAVEDKTDGLRGQYTVKIDTNGYVSGFGLASAAPIDGSPYSEFAVRADRFYIANPTLKTESMPFVVQTTSKVIDGKTIPPGVYIDDAFIGKLSADKIDARGLVIKDSAGKTILGAGTALDWGLISGADKPQDGATRNVFKGQWLSEMEYTVGDVLLFAGNSWVATISHTSSNANKPPSSATGISNYWSIYAARGDVGQGMVKGVAFLRSKTTPAAPAASEGSFTNPNPSSASGWSDGVPSGTDPLYMSTRLFTSDGLSPQQNTWTVPQLVSALGKGIRVQFSTNGTSGWSTTPSENSVYMRVQTSEDGGKTWVTDSNGVVRIKGETGAPGVPGSPGVRGTAFGYASSANDSNFKLSTGFDAKDGDQLLVSNNSGSSVYTRTSGFWVNKTALSINGDAVIAGTLAVNKIADGSKTVSGGIFGLGTGSGSTIVNGITYSGAVYGMGSTGSAVGGLFLSKGGTGMIAASVSDNWPAITAYNQKNFDFTSRQTAAELCTGSYAGRFIGEKAEAHLGYGNYAAYLTGTVGPFTGSHDALIGVEHQVVEGDIVCDDYTYSKKSVTDTIAVVSPSARRNQKNCVGIFTGFLDNHTPVALSHIWFDDEKLRIASMASLGEGQVNVCGENGDLEPGDLITTSSTPGKGAKQDDDVIHSYTVAKCREHVKFSQPNEVKQVACIYLCG